MGCRTTDTASRETDAPSRFSPGRARPEVRRARAQGCRGGARARPARPDRTGSWRSRSRSAIACISSSPRSAPSRSRDGDRAIERHHRRRRDRHQPVVQRDDRRPVGLLDARARPRGRRRSPPRRDTPSRSGPAADRSSSASPSRMQPRVPARSVLVDERAQSPAASTPRRQPRGVEAHERGERVRRRRRRRRILEQQRRQADRLAAELDPHRRLGRTRRDSPR